MESLGVASVAGDLKGTAAAMVDMELGVRVRVFGENGEGAGEGRERASVGVLIHRRAARERVRP